MALTFPDPTGHRHDVEKYKAEAHLLTEERDEALGFLRGAVVFIEATGDYSEDTKRFLGQTYRRYPFMCICHGGSVCGDACSTHHHTGCGYEA